tara:strand:- start:6 stop:188 length:183 start_codon:yes stop_codon:yes gene_type:complete
LPFWFASLDTHTQSLLVADYRISNETKKERKERQQRANKARIDKRLQQLKQREAHYGIKD